MRSAPYVNVLEAPPGALIVRGLLKAVQVIVAPWRVVTLPLAS
jgi:hypothetical protein